MQIRLFLKVNSLTFPAYSNQSMHFENEVSILLFCLFLAAFAFLKISILKMKNGQRRASACVEKPYVLLV